MKTRVVCAAVCLGLLSFVALAAGKDHRPKRGPLSGTWECTSRGGQHGEMPFTLLLQQIGETVTGSLTSPVGGSQISEASFKNKTLDIQIDTDQGSYLLTARLKNGKLVGNWSSQTQRGTWEGSKQDEMNP